MSSVWYVTSLNFGSRILYTHMSFTIRNNYHPQLPILALCQLSFKFKAFALSRAIIWVPRTCPKGMNTCSQINFDGISFVLVSSTILPPYQSPRSPIFTGQRNNSPHQSFSIYVCLSVLPALSTHVTLFLPLSHIVPNCFNYGLICRHPYMDGVRHTRTLANSFR